MNPEFWHNRWQEKRTGFHQAKVNTLLTEHFSALRLPIGGRILAPLCGKSVDMIWLAAQGYDVVGIELVETAVQDFFIEQNIQPIVSQHAENPAIKCYQSQLSVGENQQTITLWAADIFALTSADIGVIDAVYDRAALIALPNNMRGDYSKQIRDISDNAPQLIITLAYDQSKKNGPPFSVSGDQLQQYYGTHYV